jgi:nucleoside-diphosphate-sugar epimerase
MKNRVLVTGSTGRIGSAVAAQLLEKRIATRAMVHRDDARSARLRELDAEVVVADMFDIQINEFVPRFREEALAVNVLIAMPPMITAWAQVQK